jgi:hypothetical protein
MDAKRNVTVPLVYRVDHYAKVVVAAGFGTVFDDDVFGYQREIAARTDIVGYHQLIDMTHVKHIALPHVDRVADLAAEAAKMDAKHGAAKFAIVAPGDLAFGLGRMFKASRELLSSSTMEVGVFRTMEGALNFLGIDHPLTLPTLG